MKKLLLILMLGFMSLQAGFLDDIGANLINQVVTNVSNIQLGEEVEKEEVKQPNTTSKEKIKQLKEEIAFNQTLCIHYVKFWDNKSESCKDKSGNTYLFSGKEKRSFRKHKKQLAEKGKRKPKNIKEDTDRQILCEKHLHSWTYYKDKVYCIKGDGKYYNPYNIDEDFLEGQAKLEKQEQEKLLNSKKGNTYAGITMRLSYENNKIPAHKVGYLEDGGMYYQSNSGNWDADSLKYPYQYEDKFLGLRRKIYSNDGDIVLIVLETFSIGKKKYDKIKKSFKKYKFIKKDQSKNTMGKQDQLESLERKVNNGSISVTSYYNEIKKVRPYNIITTTHTYSNKGDRITFLSTIDYQYKEDPHIIDLRITYMDKNEVERLDNIKNKKQKVERKKERKKKAKEQSEFDSL